ncbi:hypothetical protein [Natrialba taiwanensis]|uniref:DUF8160 domain-containing protein n=1 Tax=Natrialba taiwanensis DSM 12281 TaxID=1230458 RepID=M0ADS0_9EURY|nr:hypothetical protein [Natrialba taiwanensis]ELY96531.1 hypothetical protein C484_00860 [Natrialba taiwanensis DSM 12281]
MNDDDVQDRLRQRFDGDEDNSSKKAKNEKASKGEMNGENEMFAKNVKKEWRATSIYLPEFLDRSLTTSYKHLDLDFEEEYGHSLQKTRHYYPLVVALGIERLESMDPEEVQERIEALEREGGNE